MGFSLAGFGAGLAESVVSRIEEERKFSAAALQGRIERASIMKQQREKEQEALTEELRGRKNELMQLGVQDNDLQIAYLTSPLAFEALKKAQSSGLKVDPRALININKEKLFTGTADEFIAKAAGTTERVEPAKILPSEGRSMLAPSEQQEQRRFQQLASMRGMSLEDVARAEGGPRARMPEPAASINFAALKKEDKTLWPEKLKALETRYTDTAASLGEDSPEAVKAKNELNTYRTLTAKLSEDQFDHTKNMSRANAILSDPSKATKEQIDWARNYRSNYDAYKKEQEAKGKQDERMPSETSLVSLARTAAGNYLRKQYPGNKDFKNIPVKDAAGNIIGEQYTFAGPRKADLDRAIAAEEQRGAIAFLETYMVDGRVTDRRVEGALKAFGVELDKDKKPIKPTTPPPVFEEQKSAGDSRATVKSAPAPAPAPAPAAAPGPGRAGQGAAPRQLSAEDRQALEWANANPRDPRAAEIRRRLGM